MATILEPRSVARARAGEETARADRSTLYALELLLGMLAGPFLWLAVELALRRPDGWAFAAGTSGVFGLGWPSLWRTWSSSLVDQCRGCSEHPRSTSSLRQ